MSRAGRLDRDVREQSVRERGDRDVVDRPRRLEAIRPDRGGVAVEVSPRVVVQRGRNEGGITVNVSPRVVVQKGGGGGL